MASLKIPTVLLCLAAAMLILTINVQAEAVGSADLRWAMQLGNKKNCNGKAIALDETGNAYVTGIYGNKTHQSIGTHVWHSSGGDVFLTKLSPEGKILWQKFSGGDGIDSGNAVATFGSNVVYLAGNFSKTIHFGKTELRAARSKEMRGYSPPDGLWRDSTRPATWSG